MNLKCWLFEDRDLMPRVGWNIAGMSGSGQYIMWRVSRIHVIYADLMETCSFTLLSLFFLISTLIYLAFSSSFEITDRSFQFNITLLSRISALDSICSWYQGARLCLLASKEKTCICYCSVVSRFPFVFEKYLWKIPLRILPPSPHCQGFSV